MIKRTAIILGLASALMACSDNQQQAAAPAAAKAMVTDASLQNAAAETSQWLTYHRSYKAQRFSPNAMVNTENVAQLGLEWFADLDTKRGQEATPLVIDGKMFITTAWSKVKAYDAKSGALLWEFDPQVPGESAVKACCDVVNRGLAAYGDKLYFGSFDGRLFALDRDSGKVVWEKVTTDPTKSYSITGAPLIVKGNVIIGNGGAEYGVRGYITAYNAETGEEAWRFYTVPGNPETSNDPAYLQEAAKTWSGEWWNLGGGGTVWDAMTYDPELDLLYIGVGNGSPWNQKIRSPEGGDNLYLSSIVAIRPSTGEYVWHYQTTPGETWDFTATQHIMLADLEIDGKQRKVLMQAPKNGFFYVIDRVTGEFISAKNFVFVTWASGIDQTTGRPIENPDARYYNKDGVVFILPGAGGAHSWQPMAFNPNEGLVYIPANIAGFPYADEKGWQPKAKGFNTGNDFSAGAMPPIPEVRNGALAATGGALIAWDPVKQEARWQVDYPAASNGGLLATAGGLVFQGTAGGEFVAYDAANGNRLWSFDAQSSILAAPISYELEGEQYVAVLVGRGGIFHLAPGLLALDNAPPENISRMMVFKLNADKSLPAKVAQQLGALNPPEKVGTAETIAQGAYSYGRFCGTCHGDAAISGGVLPDLRHSAINTSAEAWKTIVADGSLTDRGMVGWSDVMSLDEIENIRHYVINRAHEDAALEAAAQ